MVAEERGTLSDYVLRAEPDSGLDLMTVRSQPEPKTKVRRLTNCATHTPLTALYAILTESWGPRYLVKHYSGCVYAGISG